METAKCLRLAEVAPGRPFHVARVTLEPSTPQSLHTHDFGEVFFVVDGAGTYEVNGQAVPLCAGHLTLIRPADVYAFSVTPSLTLRFFNVAYPVAVWHEFCALARIEFLSWEKGALPTQVRVPAGGQDACARAFAAALDAFHEDATELAMCGFWSAIAAWLRPAPPLRAAQNVTMPHWLQGAIFAMMEDGNLQVGFPRLVELSGVSAAHLSRTLKRYQGQTPTEFVNILRLKRAARRLATTEDDIFDIADDCGFGNLSYFYRLFRQQYGQPPRAYRLQARRSVAP